MVYHERSAWAGLIGTVIAVALYLFLLSGFRAPDIVDTVWLPHMLWSIGTGLTISIILTIVWGLIANRDDPGAASLSDIRDRDISRLGGRVEHAILAIAGLIVIGLCAASVSGFWIAQTMYAGFAVSAFLGGIARVIAYRRGLV